ncbi:type VI secretion system baseplate subunit TssE [Roseateles violae]|uniref:Type VI secretion system baseplate subunit TssE n=1 Tax=Roseateles violae TaxID=3058042 RepID=A0ABT8DPX6_9BURK|nr:type VI secretion system baseplate subunit TssE [Pelomonas sp. PFR6]MDN3920028.1 type VI secretion system baseplate subunit TssE [Pelomonas sp. PFR6]
MPSEAHQRLQPALLDRLSDERRMDRSEGEEQRVMSKAALRQAVLRDLGALFNAVQALDRRDAEAYPELAGCVLNFGLPPLSGQLASKLELADLEAAIRRAILRFEPRILAETLEVRALEQDSVLDTHNVLEFEISGHLWSTPVPLEMLLRTQLDLESGQVKLRDALGGAVRAATSPPSP